MKILKCAICNSEADIITENNSKKLECSNPKCIFGKPIEVEIIKKKCIN